MSLRQQAHEILTAGAVEVSPLVDPVNRGRSSRAGQVAARVVRRLSMLLGNALVREMEGAGLRPLLAFVSSPQWVRWLGSRRSIDVAFSIRAASEPERIPQWARPVGMDGGNDRDLRGVPGGDGARLVGIYRNAAISNDVRSSLDDGWAFKKLAQASTGFARPALVFLGHLEALSAADRAAYVTQGVAAVRDAYADEAEWLTTLDGALFSRDAQAEVLPVQVPQTELMVPGRRLDLTGLDRIRVPGFAEFPIQRSPDLGTGAGPRQESAADTDREVTDSGAPTAQPPKTKTNVWPKRIAIGTGVLVGVGLLATAMGA
jgi:hypothetical protein